MPAFTIKSPAKINLHLRVAAPDESGFHPLRSWIVATSLTDTLSFDPHGEGITLRCSDPSIPADNTNLILRAARAIGATPPMSLSVAKRIPAGGGLGGGSGNAAATLAALNIVLRLQKSPAQLRAIAATLGSDVPFFLDVFLEGSRSAIATGRGEILAPTPPPAKACFGLLLLPPFGVSTASAYQELDRLRPTVPPSLLAPFDAQRWANFPAAGLLPLLVNDLELPAFSLEPRLAKLHAAAEQALDRPVRMSGSGSTLFTLFDSHAERTDAARRVKGPDFERVRTVPVELGEASGEI